MAETFYGWQLLIPMSHEAMPWFARPQVGPEVPKSLPPPRAEPDPVADLAAGIASEPPPWAKMFDAKIKFKRKSSGGRPSKGRA